MNKIFLDSEVAVDADTGEEVANEDIVRGYALDKDTFIEVSKEELEEIALESTADDRSRRGRDKAFVFIVEFCRSVLA